VWIRDAMKNKMAVGSQARILYSDTEGRIECAVQMNRAIRDGRIR
jgi:urocanate hydratase